MLTYIQALERGRLGMPYEATKVSLLRILGNGLFPERSAPPVRELQPHLYSAAHDQAPWAQGAPRASPARKDTTKGGGLASDGVLALTCMGGHDTPFRLPASVCLG